MKYGGKNMNKQNNPGFEIWFCHLPVTWHWLSYVYNDTSCFTILGNKKKNHIFKNVSFYLSYFKNNFSSLSNYSNKSKNVRGLLAPRVVLVYNCLKEKRNGKTNLCAICFHSLPPWLLILLYFSLKRRYTSQLQRSGHRPHGCHRSHHLWRQRRKVSPSTPLQGYHFEHLPAGAWPRTSEPSWHDPSHGLLWPWALC